MSFVVATAAVLYALGMALVFGGTAALSFASAPQTFRTLPPHLAGKVFGKTLRVFDAMAAVAAVVAIVGAVAGMALTISPPGIARVVLAAAIYAVTTLLRRSVAPRMADLKPPETEEDERRWEPEKRRAFDALHRQYVRLYAANLFLSLAGLALIALPA
jgi:hypothetical protein